MKLKPSGGIANDSSLVPMKEQLPLAMPLSIMIEPTNVCSFRCKFCPTGDYDLLKQVSRAKGFMKYESYVKIIDDIRFMCETNTSMLKRLHLYKDGEPLLNKDIGKMIAYAKNQNISESVETTTNGAVLTEKMALELIECGLDRIRFSIEHITDNGYREITRTFSDYKMIKRNIGFLYKEKERRNSSLIVHVKIVDSGLSDNEKEKFIADFSPISDSLRINQLMGWSKSDAKDWKLGHAVTVSMDGITKLKEWSVCTMPFSGLAINFNGTVSVCCVDWSHGTLVGNLNTQSLSDIWYGEKLRNLRLLHLRGKRSQIDACSNCDFIRGLCEYDKLDDDTDRLLQVYSKT